MFDLLGKKCFDGIYVSALALNCTDTILKDIGTSVVRNILVQCSGFLLPSTPSNKFNLIPQKGFRFILAFRKAFNDEKEQIENMPVLYMCTVVETFSKTYLNYK